MEKENYESSKIIITDDNNDSNLLYDITDRIFELRDQLSLDIISKNIIENIDNPVAYRTINYVTKFKENYNRIKEENLFNNDLEIINEYFAELSQLILTKLSLKFNVTIGNNINDDTITDIDSYIDKLETMYEFFVVRRYDNIRDYFKVQLLKNKINFVEKYKNVLEENNAHEDIFFNINKKKFSDPVASIIIYYVDDIVSDIQSNIVSAYDFFKDIISLDLFEEYNNRMNDMIINFGNDLMILNDTEAVNQYLSILNDKEIRITLENDILATILDDSALSNKNGK